MCWGAGVTSATTCAPLSWRGGGRPAPRGGKVPGCPGPRPLAPPPPGLGPSRVCGRAPSRLAGLHSRPCVAACCGAQAGGRAPRSCGNPGLTCGRPHSPQARPKGRLERQGADSPPPRAPSNSPPKPLPARSLFPLPQPRESRTKESWRALGALPRCFPGTTDAREPAPGERVGGQIREAAGWGR